MLGFLIGLAGGAVVIEILWRIKIREKADLGTRLCVGDKLYKITEDGPV